MGRFAKATASPRGCGEDYERVTNLDNPYIFHAINNCDGRDSCKASKNKAEPPESGNFEK